MAWKNIPIKDFDLRFGWFAETQNHPKIRKIPRDSVGSLISKGKMIVMRIVGITRVLACVLIGGLVLAQVATRPDPVVLFVNELPVFSSEFNRAQLENPAAALPLKGFFKTDRDNLALASVVKAQAIQFDASHIEVSSSEVDKEISDLIKQNDWDFLEFKQNIEAAGYSVESYRRQIRQELRKERRITQIKSQVSLSPEELNLFYDLFKNRYSSNGKPQAFVQIKSKLENDARTVKTNATLENWYRKLMMNAKLRTPENSSLEIYNPTVAKMNNSEIDLWILNQHVYNDPQFLTLQNISQNLTTELQKLKTSKLEQLIDQCAALEFAKKSAKPFIGTGQDLLEAVTSYQLQNLTVTDAEAKLYYQANPTAFQTPGVVSFKSFTFANPANANAFRNELIRNQLPIENIAAKYNQDRTNKWTQSTTEQLIPSIKKAIFDQKLTKVKNGLITQAIKINTKTLVFFVQNIQYPKTRDYNQVKTEALQKTLAYKRQTTTNTWLQNMRKTLKLENQLPAIQKDSEARGNRSVTITATQSNTTTSNPRPQPKTPTLQP
jgi:PPIC-type PPIASE domain